MTGRPAPLPRLHVLTDPRADRRSLDLVEAALDAGASCVQVRAKGVDDRAFLAFATAVVERCRAVGARCLVNDRVDIALAADADGVHLGGGDLPVAVARRLVGDRLVIGGTARDPRTAAALVADGADYLGAGPVFTTRTKVGLPDPIGFEVLAAIVRAVDVPVIAISGITASRIPDVLATGAHGVAVTAAITAAEDPRAATAALLAQLPSARAGATSSEEA